MPISFVHPSSFVPAAPPPGGSPVLAGRVRPTSGGDPLTLPSCCRRSAGRTEDVDPVALGQAHDRPLGVGTPAEAAPGPLALALAIDRVDPGHLDAEDLLDRDLHLRLVGILAHQEGVLVLLVDQAVALLGDDRLDDDVARVGDL